jgi:hypothetical protein
MGMYWQTILYYGRMLSPEAKQRLTDVNDTDRFLTKVAEDRWILHAPNKKITMGNIDPILEDQEKHQGFVTFGAIDEWLKHKGREAKWGAVTEDELSRLNELVVIAAGGDPTAKPGVYVCEISWCTLNFPEEVDPGVVTYNIKARAA